MQNELETTSWAARASRMVMYKLNVITMLQTTTMRQLAQPEQPWVHRDSWCSGAGSSVCLCLSEQPTPSSGRTQKCNAPTAAPLPEFWRITLESGPRDKHLERDLEIRVPCKARAANITGCKYITRGASLVVDISHEVHPV